MIKKIVFLSGPMSRVPEDKALNWRKRAVELLSDKFTVKHAYRGREKKETFPDYRLAVIRDKYDVLHSDVLLVNDVDIGGSMIGTAMEILIAFQNNIPVIVFGDGHPNNYFLNYHSHVRCKTLEEACDLINNMFSD